MILETTPVKWETYFGISLGEKEAMRFLEANWWNRLAAAEQLEVFQHHGKDIEWFNSLIDKNDAGCVPASMGSPIMKNKHLHSYSK